MHFFITVVFFILSSCLPNHLLSNTLKYRDKDWSHVLKTIPQGVANPLITKAIELSFKAHPKHLSVTDLGSGTGRNISVLLEKGAKVYAYDASLESINILHKEYSTYIQEKRLFVFQKYFQEIAELPKADLVIAWRSLSFMNKNDFLIFWPKIKASITPYGMFTGTFFGQKHYTKMDQKNSDEFKLSHSEVFKLLTDFKILHFQEELEYDEEASKEAQCDQYEHLYRIIAVKTHP